MANLVWVGAASTDSTNVNNWIVQGTPNPPTSIATNDDFFFGIEAGGDCTINQAQIGSITTDQNFARAGHKLIFGQATLTIQGCMNLASEQIVKFTQSTTNITFSGGQSSGSPDYNYPVIYMGDVVYDTGGSAKNTVTYTITNGNSDAAHITYGDLPKIVLQAGKFSWNLGDTTISGAHVSTQMDEDGNPFTKCCSLTINTNVTFVNTPLNHDELQQKIQVTGDGVSSGQHFSCSAAILDFSNAKLIIDAKNTQQVPCTNDVTNFGSSSGFTALLEDFVVGNGNGSGNRLVVPEGLTLECASLEIQSGSYLFGGGTNLQTGAKSHIHVVEKPTIKGTWNFEETTDGIYSTIGGVSSISAHTGKFDNVDIVDKLTVGGLIDPTGLELTPVAANPGGTAANTLWLNSGDSNKLYHGSSEVASGGGGGGTVDVVSNVATSRILGRVSSGSGDSEELTQSQVLAFLGNVEAGADVTDATNVTAAGALMDSELTDLAGVKGVTISTLQVKPSEGAFANGDKTKLDTIETNADVTDTANVTAAGALMDSEVTNLSQVKAFDSSDYATAAQGAKADSAQQPPSEGAFVNGDKTKLDAIEANADVTDTANVTAAGALMDSEVTNLAQVKAFDSSAYATAAQGAKADTALQAGSAIAPGDPVSALANDANYLDAATTPTAIFGRWELTTAVNGLAEATDNLLAVDDSSGFTRTGTLTGFSGGTFTANAATAGTYYVNARLHFGDSTTGTSISETSGNKYTLQILIFHGTTMEGFGRIQKNGFWVDDHFETSTIVTLADGDTLQIKHKMVDHAASSTKYRIKNGGGNPANAIIMVKLA